MEKKVIRREGVEMMRMIMVVLMCAVSVSVMMTMMIPCVDAAAYKKPDMYKVGDSDNGWRPGLNYTNWAAKHHFYVGDWLYFGFDRRMYNVLEVNQTDYEACRSDHPITNVSRGAGRDVFNLTTAKPFYFLSSGGYCWHGMRVTVTTEEYTGVISSPAPSPSPNGSPSVSVSVSVRNVILTVISAIVVGWTLV